MRIKEKGKKEEKQESRESDMSCCWIEKTAMKGRKEKKRKREQNIKGKTVRVTKKDNRPKGVPET